MGAGDGLAEGIREVILVVALLLDQPQRTHLTPALFGAEVEVDGCPLLDREEGLAAPFAIFETAALRLPPGDQSSQLGQLGQDSLGRLFQDGFGLRCRCAHYIRLRHAISFRIGTLLRTISR